jgi:hypothetical protein
MFGPDATPGNVGGGGVSTLSSVPIRQAYITLRTPVANSAIDWKLGVFDTIIGYESTTDGANPNYTRSYGYTMEPTTQTGVLGTFKANDEVSFSAGLADTTYANGYLPGVNSGTTGNGSVGAMTYPTALGSVALTAPDSWGWVKGATFNAGIINSPGSGQGGATSYYAGVTVPTPLSALKTGLSFDYLDMHNAKAAGNHGNDSIWDVALYGNYQATDKLSFNLRGEYLNQQNVGASATSIIVYSGSGRPPQVEELTATVQYSLWANVLTRAEIRWDHAETSQPFTSNSGLTSTGDAFTFALNVIYQF